MTDLSSAVVMIACLPSDVTLIWVMFGGSSGVAKIFLLLVAGSVSVLAPIYFNILAPINDEYLSPMKIKFSAHAVNKLLNLPKDLQYFLSAMTILPHHHQVVVSTIVIH